MITARWGRQLTAEQGCPELLVLGSAGAHTMEGLLHCCCYLESNFYGRPTLGKPTRSENMKRRAEAVLTGEMRYKPPTSGGISLRKGMSIF